MKEAEVIPIEPAVKHKGKITRVDLDKGYGFISSPNVKFRRIFFHWEYLVQDTLKFEKLTRGMKVEFELVDKGDENYHAMKVRVVE